MKLKVTHSAMPWAASVRRTSSVRVCFVVSVGSGSWWKARQRDGRHRIEAAQPQHFLDEVGFRFDHGTAFGRLGGHGRVEGLRLRQLNSCRDIVAPGGDGNCDAGRIVVLHGKAEPIQRCNGFFAGNGGATETGDPLEAQGGRTLPGRQCPRSMTSPGSPPQSSSTIAVAASNARGISTGSIPRSKRWRASETIAWRRPVSATRMGSNNAHSMNALVVRSSHPVGSPPITPAIDCTPAASAMAQSSWVTM